MDKQKRSSILAIAFSAIICLASLLSFNFFAEASEAEKTVVDTGTKYNVTWTLYDDGELCIEGNGQLSFPNMSTDISNKVEKLTIGKGINSLSYMDIPSFKNLKSIQVEEGNTGFFVDDFGVLFSSNNKLIKFPAASETTEYIIPDYAVSVYSNAFKDAENIAKISGGNNVEMIGSEVFYGCINLTDITIPDKLTNISSDTFRNCTSLESITIPNNVTTIENGAFYGCTSLSTVIFKESSQLTSIKATAFKNTAYSNDPANWDNGFLYLGNYLIAAKENDVSENCRLYSKTVLIADEVFSGFKKITSVYIPNGTKYIGNNCFSGCSNLISVRLPADLYEIGSYAFTDCTSLKEIEMPSSVKTIPANAFSGCSSLDKITLHNGLETIETYSFKETSLKETYIPKTVTSVSQYAFDSSSITDIYFGSSKADWKRATQNKSLGNITIHYTLESDDKSVMIVHTDDDFDYETGNVHLAVTDLGKTTSTYEQNGFYNRLMANPIQILDIKLVDNDENNIQPLEGHKITVKIKASEEFMNLMKSGLSAVGEYDVDANCIDFKNDNFIFEENGEMVSVAADENFLQKFKVIHWYSYASKEIDHEHFTHDKITVENGYIILETSHFSEYAVCTELVEFEVKEKELSFGQTTKLNVTAAENTKLNFMSSDSGIVSVDNDGNITATGAGTATITVTIDGTSISSTCTITVPAREFTVTWNIDGNETSESVCENDVIPAHTAPSKAGFVFVGWTPEVPEKMPAYSLKFTAVYKKASVTSIEIISLPSKTNYTYKIGSLDLDGIVIKAVYSDGTTEIISDTAKINAHGFSVNSTGKKDVVVEYGGCTAKFQITVSYAWWQQIIRFLLLGFIWY